MQFIKQVWSSITIKSKEKQHLSNGRKSRLHLAILDRDLKKVQRLLEDFYPDPLDQRKMTPLHYACQKGYNDIVKILIQNKADVNHPTGKLWTPLHIAAWARHLDTCHILIESGADVLIENRDGKTAFKLCQERGNHDIVTFLEKLNAERNT